MRTVFAIALTLLAGCAQTDDPPAAPGSALTDKGLYSLVLQHSDEPYPAGTPVALIAAISDEADGQPVLGAGFTVVPFMPDMGHGIPDDPVIDEGEEGVYTATWTFSMAGAWELDLEIDAAAGVDGVTLSYDVQ